MRGLLDIRVQPAVRGGVAEAASQALVPNQPPLEHPRRCVEDLLVNLQSFHRVGRDHADVELDWTVTYWQDSYIRTRLLYTDRTLIY